MTTGGRLSDLYFSNQTMGGVFMSNEPEETDDTDEKDSRKRHPELLALERATRILDELSFDARRRAARWLFDLYCSQETV